MPIVGKAILGGILAHRRHGDSVAETDAADRQRAQQVDLGHLPVVISAGATCAGNQPHGLIIRSVDHRLTRSICFGLYFHRVVLCWFLVFRGRPLVSISVKIVSVEFDAVKNCAH